MDVESCISRIWEVVLDSYGLNVELTTDGRIVYQSDWAVELKEGIRAILEEELCGVSSGAEQESTTLGDPGSSPGPAPGNGRQP